MSAPRTVVGASDHYGRAELVTLGRRDGAPVLLDRRTARLIAEDERLTPVLVPLGDGILVAARD